ncbi:YheC/YheD family protein [Cohnella nanjingensis]|uniref:YheC/YheD family protein n=1 Tax=Cohnella nanjingensis TaxID=1387779 RepID=A0A7X0RLT7_9BACL|nr:YheC/YheD family protein [Cohnella nanjingensis]MBB6669658.1 YheC/YheD family protein [Cohnella nanjingensis]
MEISIRRNKYIKYRFMRQSRKLRRHLPKTEIFTKDKLSEFLEAYRDVIVKPIDGKRGLGVIRITASGLMEYEMHWEDKKKTIDDADELFEKVSDSIGSRNYIIQRRIPLASVHGRPFDIRVIVQRRDKADPWQVTGKVAKVAGDGYIVTNNERSNGTVLPLRTAIGESELKHMSRSSLLHTIDKVAVRASEKLCKLYTDQYIFGFDMGLDRYGDVWIIEANLSPMLTHFKKLKDQRMFRRILREERYRIRD